MTKLELRLFNSCQQSKDRGPPYIRETKSAKLLILIVSTSSLLEVFMWFLYSCNNITTTLIQISRLFYFGFFSKTNHQMMI